jgi:translocator protein
MNKATLLRITLFIALNFLALALGSLLMGQGPVSDWYQNMNIAPWTPPGFVFGLAWTTIMLLFGIFLGLNFSRNLVIPYIIHIAANIAWNPLFFNFNKPFAALLLFPILLVTLYKINQINLKHSLLLAPYYIWLLIAISLNAYIVVYN